MRTSVPDIQPTSQVAADTLQQFVADADKCLGGVARDTHLLRKVLGQVERAHDMVWCVVSYHMSMQGSPMLPLLVNGTKA
jgi:hypothetical protein